MSDDQIETNDNTITETPKSSRLEELSIQELRKLATSYQIKAQRDWDRDDFILAINTRRQRNTLVELAEDNANAPKPGHAWITIPSQEKGSNHPVPLNVNGTYPCYIPRDVRVEVPLEILEVLNNSVTPKYFADPSGKTDVKGNKKLVMRMVPSYPFQFHQMTPGTARYPNGQPKIKPSTSPEKHSLKMKYREIYGRWPKRVEFKKFRDMHMERTAAKVLDAEEITMAKKSKEA